MIGNLNKKIFFLILLVPFLFSCGNIETDNETNNETGRYQVIEKRESKLQTPEYWSISNKSSVTTVWFYNYYLLDTKTGEIKKIDFEEIE